MTRWQDMKTAPKDGSEIDVWMWDRLAGFGWREIEVMWRDGAWVTYSEDGGYEPVGLPGIQDPFYWMAPPGPPVWRPTAPLPFDGRAGG